MSEINTKQQEIDRNLEYFKDKLPERWLRLSEQIFRIDKWSVCRG